MSEESKIELTIGEDLIYELIDNETLKTKLTNEAFDTFRWKMEGVVDQWIMDRCSGKTYAPELNSYLSDEVRKIVKTEVDNYLRCSYNDIKKAVDEEVNKKLEENIKSTVNSALEQMKKKIVKDLTT